MQLTRSKVSLHCHFVLRLRETPVRAVRDSTDSQSPKAAFEIARTRAQQSVALAVWRNNTNGQIRPETQGRRARESVAERADAEESPSTRRGRKQAVARTDRLVLEEAIVALVTNG